MRKIKFKALYDGKWYEPALVGGTLVPQVFNSNGELVNLCAHTEEYHVVQFDNNDEIVAIYGNPELITT
jgi:hypothetical protein